jgi:coenzyme Q-binding protein COQ10
MTHMNRTLVIHAPMEKVYAVARDPNRWPTWFVGMSEIDNLTGEGGVGTVVECDYTLAGMHFPVTVKVVEDRLDTEGGRWKGTIEGPLAGEQTWTYAPQGGDTEITVDLEYTVPGKALGKIADRLIIERAQDRTAEQTMENLRAICEAE